MELEEQMKFEDEALNDFIAFLQTEASVQELESIHFLNKKLWALDDFPDTSEFSPVRRFGALGCMSTLVTIMQHPELPDSVFENNLKDLNNVQLTPGILFRKITKTLTTEQYDKMVLSDVLLQDTKRKLLEDNKVSRAALEILLENDLNLAASSSMLTPEDVNKILQGTKSQPNSHSKAWAKVCYSQACTIERVFNKIGELLGMMPEDESVDVKNDDIFAAYAYGHLLNALTVTREEEFLVFLKEKYGVDMTGYGKDWIIKFLNWK